LAIHIGDRQGAQAISATRYNITLTQ
jgi:hypothetical protein